MRVAVVGMGYVGCVTAACLSRDGHQVIGVDVDESKVKALNAGVSPIHEPGLDELVQGGQQSKRLRATTSIVEAVENTDVALIAVGTPSADDGSVNYRTVLRVIEELGAALRDQEKNYTVVVRSTLLPGVLEEILQPALCSASGCEIGGRILLCNNPEFLRETTAIRDYDQPPFVLIGAADDESARDALALYENLDCEKLVVSTRVAALVKYASNAYHALKIAFANEIGTLARAFGADGQEVMKVVCADTQLNVSRAYLRPGFAFGGSCLPKDVRALVRHAQQHNLQCDVLQGILPSNQSHLDRALRMVKASGKRRIGLIGLSFKAGTDDLRESPQVMLAETLLGQGFELQIVDPDVRVTALVGTNLHFIDQHLPHLAKLLCEDIGHVMETAELLVLCTDTANAIPEIRQFEGDVIDVRRDLVVASHRTEELSKQA